MTNEERKIVEYALNIARLKTAKALVDKTGKLCHVLDGDVETYIGRFERGIEVAANNELLARSMITRPSIAIEPEVDG